MKRRIQRAIARRQARRRYVDFETRPLLDPPYVGLGDYYHMDPAVRLTQEQIARTQDALRAWYDSHPELHLHPLLAPESF